MTDTDKSFQQHGRGNRRPSRQGKANKKRFFGFGKNRRPSQSRPESAEESLDRQRSSENAKKIIESFEEDTKSYRHTAHGEGKLSQSLSFYLILGIAVLAVIITVVLIFLRKGS